ncbi:MAG: DUF1467 family protein [Sphingopyxis sp.]
MLWQSALAIYFLFWFLSLFLVLPFHGRRSEDEASEGEQGEVGASEDRVSEGGNMAGHDRGAPAHFPFMRAALQVTLLSAFLFTVYYTIYSSGLVTRETFSLFAHPPR